MGSGWRAVQQYERRDEAEVSGWAQGHGAQRGHDDEQLQTPPDYLKAWVDVETLQCDALGHTFADAEIAVRCAQMGAIAQEVSHEFKKPNPRRAG